jgi:hypothetical protein
MEVVVVEVVDGRERRLMGGRERGPLLFAEPPPVASRVPADINLCPVTGWAYPTGAGVRGGPGTAIMLLR